MGHKYRLGNQYNLIHFAVMFQLKNAFKWQNIAVIFDTTVVYIECAGWPINLSEASSRRSRKNDRLDMRACKTIDHHPRWEASTVISRRFAVTPSVRHSSSSSGLLLLDGPALSLCRSSLSAGIHTAINLVVEQQPMMLLPLQPSIAQLARWTRGCFILLFLFLHHHRSDHQQQAARIKSNRRSIIHHTTCGDTSVDLHPVLILTLNLCGDDGGFSKTIPGCKSCKCEYTQPENRPTWMID